MASRADERSPTAIRASTRRRAKETGRLDDGLSALTEALAPADRHAVPISPFAVPAITKKRAFAGQYRDLRAPEIAIESLAPVENCALFSDRKWLGALSILIASTRFGHSPERRIYGDVFGIIALTHAGQKMASLPYLGLASAWEESDVCDCPRWRTGSHEASYL